MPESHIAHLVSTDEHCFEPRVLFEGPVMKDYLEIRCPKLGGEVTFAYCLVEGGELPCSRTIACWQQYFPVETHLRAKLTQAQWNQCFGKRPKEKMVSLVELIEAAKKRKQSEG